MCSRAVERVRDQFLLPMNLDGRDVFTTASVGLPSCSPGYQSAEELLRDADTAMYRAKASGEGRHEYLTNPCTSRPYGCSR